MSAQAPKSTTPPSAPTPASLDANGAKVTWLEWSPEVFERAQTENKLLLVFVGTEWCHWCHVMDDKTWGDPAVAALLTDAFIAVRVDADARPDVAERYEQWAWPATAVLTPDARPVVEMKGYRHRNKVLALLGGIVDDHRAGRDVGRRLPPAPDAPAADTDLEAARAFAEQQLDAVYDEAIGGWGGPKKYPLLAPMQLAWRRAARRGEQKWAERARFTLVQQRQIVDPVWGGLYQYSAHNDWQHPHYEKLAFMQGWALTMAAEAWLTTGDPSFLDDGRATRRYVMEHLSSPEGTFYANQDADVGTPRHGPSGSPSAEGTDKASVMPGAAFYALDDAGRRAVGAPFVDPHIFAEHNGYIIAGLARFAAAADDEVALSTALRAADQILATHRRGALFVHEPADTSGRRHLADQVAMVEALVALYEATGDLRWREEALVTLRALRASLFDDVTGAFFAHTLTGEETGVFARRRRPFELSVRASRLLLLAASWSDVAGVKGWREDALLGLKYFASPHRLAPQGRAVGDFLLAVDEALVEPVHIAVVAADAEAMSPLYRAALSLHAPGRVLERVRPGERFPDLGRPAAFVCGASFCSAPQFTPEQLKATAASFLVAETTPVGAPEVSAEGALGDG